MLPAIEAKKPKRTRAKTVFVVESDPVRRNEIKESMSEQKHWFFEFFDNAETCLEKTKQLRPLAVFLDLQHFDKTHDEKYGFQLIDRFKKSSPETEVLVFSEIDNEIWAAESLQHGALDYIIFNPHKYLKMKYELQWLEQVKDKQAEDKRFIRMMMLIIGGLVVFILLMTVLYEMGYLKEGVDTEILIGY